MQAWENFLKSQEKELGVETVALWLRTLKIVDYDACNIYLEAVDTFQIQWFEEHVRLKAKKFLKNNNSKPIHVHFTANSSKNKKKTASKESEAENSPEKFKVTFDQLDPNCTFEKYVCAEGNDLTYKLLCKICGCDEETGTVIPNAIREEGSNPIYVYGIGGTGKTHLLQSAANALRQQGLNAIYIRAETFTGHVVAAIRSSEMSLCRQAYRNVDAIIIDDVHVFSKKAATQEELFHTFNTLHLSNKLIILGSNVAPANLQQIEPRLVSRFEWGIVLPLTIPTAEDLGLILQEKALSFKVDLHKKVIDYLVQTFTSSSKALIKALEALLLRCPHAKSLITVPMTEQYLTDLIVEEQKLALNTGKILQTVVDHFGMRTEDILGKSQNRDCVLPRQMAMHFCRTQLNLPFMKVGELFSKDHSTVMSSVRGIQKNLDDDDPEVTFAWNSIFRNLKHF